MTATVVENETTLAAMGAAYEARRIAGDVPAWWDERRAAARDAFEKAPWPTERDEPWRYSQIDKLKFDSFNYERPEASGVSAPGLLKDEDAAGRIVLDNGHIRSVELSDELKSAGVYLAPLSKALSEKPELLEKYHMTKLVTPQYSKFASFHGALATEGGVLVIPKGVEVEKPIEVLNIVAGENITLFPYLLIVVEDNAKLSFVNSYSSPKDGATGGLVVGAMELFAGANSEVNFITVNDESYDVHHFEIQRHLAGRDARVKNLVLTLGSGFTRMNVEACLAESGANSEMLGLWVGGGKQRFDHRTLQEHKAPNCYSNVLYKGALLEKSRTVYAGLIQVDEIAQQTDAYQTNRNMVMSDKARADTIPMLEIAANDVRCSHGATVGQIEYEHLFYLMSRGVPKAVAEQLIVFGFFEEVLNKLPIPAVADELRDRIGENLIGVDYAQLSAARKLVKAGK